MYHTGEVYKEASASQGDLTISYQTAKDKALLIRTWVRYVFTCNTLNINQIWCRAMQYDVSNDTRFWYWMTYAFSLPPIFEKELINHP